MQPLIVKEAGIDKVFQAIQNSRRKAEGVEKTVKTILKNVQTLGDSAILSYIKQFNCPQITSIEVSPEEIEMAYASLSKTAIQAIKSAKKNIETFHKSTIRRREPSVETIQGVKVWREFRPIEKVGLYVPGGKAAYPSTLLMLAIPAKLAQCQEIVLCTPADQSGQCQAGVLGAAKICGIKKIYKVGGAEAIGAMAYGTQTIPKVYKIFGPGNQFVTTAKMMVYGEVAIDMPAGPSEVLIIADETAPPEFIAADLLAQLEHGEDSQAILLTSSKDVLKMVLEATDKQAKKLSRQKIVEKSLKNSFGILCQNEEEIISLANEYGAEHLEIMTKKDDFFLRQINNVGSVFLGKWSSESLGDYATGSNHTLPTSGFSKMFSPLSTESFGKMIQVQKVSKKGFETLRPTVETLADLEGLEAHKKSVSIRSK